VLIRSSACKGQVEAVGTAALCVGAAAGLHGAAGQRTGHGIGGDAVEVEAAAIAIQLHVIATFRIFARKIEKVDTGEDGKEATKEGNGVDGVARVEALEEDEGGDESAGGESDIVQGVDTRWVS